MKKRNIFSLLILISLVFFGFNKTTKKDLNTTKGFFYTAPTITEHNNMSMPLLGKSFVGFKEAIAFKESQGNYKRVSKLGYLGKYQFGKSTLKRLKIVNSINFLNNPSLQEDAFIALCAINKWILRKDLKRFVGKTINGVKITESGILAAAHLSGAGSVKKYLRSYGEITFSDAFGTSIHTYLRKFSGYDTSFIKANKKPIL